MPCVTFVADEDYALYLECLEDAAVRWGCAVHAYVLMTNYVHLLVTPDSADGLGRMVQSLGRAVIPRHAGGGGRVFPGLLPLHRIEPGAGRHGGGARRLSLVELACPCRGGRLDAVVRDPQYAAQGTAPIERRAAYRALFATALDDDTVTAIRDGTNKAWALGGERFKAELAALTERRLAPVRPRKVENVA